MKLFDASGGSYGAKVTSNNKLSTQSVSRDEFLEACVAGVGYNINTGDITLTSDNESALFYFSYAGDDPFIVTEIIFIIGATTGGSGDGVARIYRNPTGGGIVTNEVAVDIEAARDFASSIAISGDIYKGAEGDTITGGGLFASSTRSSFGTVITFDAGPIVLRKGNALGCSWEPPASNTSQMVKIAVSGYILTSDVLG